MSENSQWWRRSGGEVDEVTGVLRAVRGVRPARSSGRRGRGRLLAPRAPFAVVAGGCTASSLGRRRSRCPRGSEPGTVLLVDAEELPRGLSRMMTQPDGLAYNTERYWPPDPDEPDREAPDAARVDAVVVRSERPVDVAAVPPGPRMKFDVARCASAPVRHPA